MEIKILGTGCPKCKTTQDVVERVLADNGIEARVIKVDDMMDIMNYNVVATPAVVVDEVVKIKGRVPSEKEVKVALGLKV